MKHPEDLEYYDRVVKNGYGLDGRGAPVVTTIHGSKGRQAEGVTVFNEMGRRCWDDQDTEHRLAYVASTRTRGDLEICADRRVEWAASQYDYPTEEGR
jgi:superfamily I DNA/RNA helicase